MTKPKSKVAKSKVKPVEMAIDTPVVVVPPVVVETVIIHKSELVELVRMADELGNWRLPVAGRAGIVGRLEEWKQRNRETLES